jgi:hypothetical protein
LLFIVAIHKFPISLSKLESFLYKPVLDPNLLAVTQFVLCDKPVHPEHLHPALSLDRKSSSRFTMARVGDSLPYIAGDINRAYQAVALHAGSGVDRIAP